MTSLAPPTASNPFANPNAFATTLLVAFVDKYGMDGLEWSQETIKLELLDDFNVKPSPAVIDRLMAGIALVTTDGFYCSLPDFINYCNVLSGDLYDPTAWNPADAAEIAWGITEAMLIEPPDDKTDEPFDIEITTYIGKVLDAEGISDPPDILQIATGRADFDPHTYSDDPTMFQMVYEHRTRTSDNIRSMLRTNLLELTQQLQQLRLQTGTTNDVVRRAFTSLGSITQEETDE